MSLCAVILKMSNIVSLYFRIVNSHQMIYWFYIHIMEKEGMIKILPTNVYTHSNQSVYAELSWITIKIVSHV